MSSTLMTNFKPYSGEVHSRNKTNDCLSGFVATLHIAGNT